MIKQLFILFMSFILFSPTSNAQIAKKDTYPIYIMGVEDLSKKEFEKMPSSQVMMYRFETALAKDGDKKTSKAVSKTTSEENKESLRKTLESFQESIRGLCISELELNLGFSVSAQAWVVVTGEVAASVKVVLKNPKQECK